MEEAAFQQHLPWPICVLCGLEAPPSLGTTVLHPLSMRCSALPRATMMELSNQELKPLNKSFLLYMVFLQVFREIESSLT